MDRGDNSGRQAITGKGFSAVNPSGVTRAAAMSEPFSSRYTTLLAGSSAVISKNHSAVATHRLPSTKPSAAPMDCNFSLSEKAAEKRLRAVRGETALVVVEQSAGLPSVIHRLCLK